MCESGQVDRGTRPLSTDRAPADLLYKQTPRIVQLTFDSESHHQQHESDQPVPSGCGLGQLPPDHRQRKFSCHGTREPHRGQT